MIIELLLDCIYGIFYLLTMPINIPSLSDEVAQYFDTFLGYLTSGVSILDIFSHSTYLLTLLGIVVAIDIGVKLYQFVMWILKKIPMLSVS